MSLPEDAPLLPQHKRFVDEYLINPDDASACARIAGYVDRPKQNAAYLLGRPNVQKAIREGQEQAIQKTGITKERVISELAKIAFSNLHDYLDIDPISGQTTINIAKMSKDTGAALAEIQITKGKLGNTVKIKNLDKISALTTLGKHLGLFNDKLDVNHNVSLYKLIEQSYNAEHPSVPALEEIVIPQESPEEVQAQTEEDQV